MKVYEVDVNYVIEMDKDEFELLGGLGHDEIIEKVLVPFVAEEINYSGHFGPCVYFRAPRGWGAKCAAALRDKLREIIEEG